MRLLLVEDNNRLATLVRDGLERQGFAVDWCETLDGANDAYETYDYDLIVLDLGLPDGDGLEFVSGLRARKSHVPVLVLTARSGLDDRIIGLDAGADDYVVKPFHLPELAARCRALLRRPVHTLEAVLSLANVSLFPSERAVKVDGKAAELSPREIDLLEILLRRAGHVVAKQSIESALYSMDADITPNAMEAAVSRLRRHLKEAGAEVQIKTVHGVGYAIFETDFAKG